MSHTGCPLEAMESDAVSVLSDLSGDDVGFLWTGGIESQVIAHMLLERADTDVDFLTIDTGNQFDAVYEFRQDFADEHDFDWHVRQNDEVLSIIRDPRDERGYHGEGPWSVEESCGRLKTEPLYDFVTEDGYETLVTGTRRSDPLAPDSIDLHVDREEPTEHTRVHPLVEWDEAHVWAYVQYWFVPYPDCYDEGVRHTDSECCAEDDAIGEHDPNSVDPAQREARDKLQELGYV